jgi:hypothetical protein
MGDVAWLTSGRVSHRILRSRPLWLTGKQYKDQYLKLPVAGSVILKLRHREGPLSIATMQILPQEHHTSTAKAITQNESMRTINKCQ